MDLGNLLDNDEMTAVVPFGDNDDSATVTLRYVAPEEISRIARKATSWHKKQRREVVDNIKSGILLGRAAVLGWDGINVNGKPFPYSPENCDLLMTKSYDFIALVNDTVTDLQSFVKEEVKAARKN